jgi:hypothetical protein
MRDVDMLTEKSNVYKYHQVGGMCTHYIGHGSHSPRYIRLLFIFKSQVARPVCAHDIE